MNGTEHFDKNLSLIEFEANYITLEEMQELESRVEKTAWIIADDAAVRKLVKSEFTGVTAANLLRNVEYRFLVSKKNEEIVQNHIKTELAKLPNVKASQFQCKAVSDETMKLILPGCIFDSQKAKLHNAYYRAPVSNGFYWITLDAAHRDQYTDGFEMVWLSYKDGDKLASALTQWKFVGAIVLPMLLAAVAAAFILALTIRDSADAQFPKTLFYTAFGMGAIWSGVVYSMARVNKKIRQTPLCKALGSIASLVWGGGVLTVGMDFLLRWLHSK